MNLKIQTIITDLDGTLLTNENKISKETKKILIEAQQKGIKVVLASGRSTKAILPYAEELLLDKYSGYVLSYNGACLYDCKSKKVIYKKQFDLELIKEILNHLDNFDVTTIVNDNKHVYVHDVFGGTIHMNGYFGDDLQEYNVIEGEARSGDYLLREVNSLSDFIDFPLYKILVASEEKYFNEHKGEIITPFIGKCNTLFSSPFFLEFTHLDADKGITISNILTQYGIDLDTTIAFGDGGNDYNMLKVVKLGVSMGNATDEIKEVSDIVTKNNNEDGIRFILKNYVS